MDFKTIPVSLDQLLLDPNNYRLLDLPNYKKPSQNRFHETTVQNYTMQLGIPVKSHTHSGLIRTVKEKK